MCDCCDYVAAHAGRADEDTLRDEYQTIWRRRVRARIDDGGWYATSVESWPWLTYTTGLWSHGHPELCIFGLEPPQGHQVLDAVGALVTEGLHIGDGDEIPIRPGLPLLAFPLPKPENVILKTYDFYERGASESIPALQLMYPDVHGVWPWEPDCHLFPGSQPMPGEYNAWVDPADA